MQDQNIPAVERIVVINVDGVLTNAKTYWAKRGQSGAQTADALDLSILRILARFCDKIDAKVVIASAWTKLYKTTDAWVKLFKERGIDLTVIHTLDRHSCSWYEATLEYMADKPNVSWVLLEDNPPAFPEGETRVIDINALVGLTTVDLENAAVQLAPQSDMLHELRELNKSFTRPMMVGVARGNGPVTKVHLHNLANTVNELAGVCPAKTC